MLSIVKTMGLQGIEGYLICVQVDISSGMPYWDIVRLSRYKRKRIKRKSKNCNEEYGV